MCAGEIDRLQGLRPRPHEAEGESRRDGAQPGMVRQVRLWSEDGDGDELEKC